MSRLRLFTAVELPAPTRRAVAALSEALLAAPPPATPHPGSHAIPHRVWARGLSPVPAANLHVTVHFLGDADDTQVPAITAALEAALAPLPRFSTRLLAAGAFPSTRKPRTVWCGVADPAGSLERLAAAVGTALAPLGFPPEERAFHPHVTLARLRDQRVARVVAERLRAASDRSPPSPGALPVDRLTLFRSTMPRQTGERAPRYEALAHVALGGGAADPDRPGGTP